MFRAVGSLGWAVKTAGRKRNQLLGEDPQAGEFNHWLSSAAAVTLGKDVLGLGLGPSPQTTRDSPLRRSPVSHQ